MYNAFYSSCSTSEITVAFEWCNFSVNSQTSKQIHVWKTQEDEK